LTHIIARHCGLVADEFVHFIGNAHIYENHIDTLKTQIQRVPLDFPRIEITNLHDNINDYSIDDLKWIEEYKHHATLKMDMSA